MAQEQLKYLDGWRGMAIAFLLLGHFFPIPGVNFGAIGVNLFFVLSGHLMANLLFVQETPIPVFYRRRISRILPAHLVFIALVCVAFALSGQPVDMKEAVTALFFLNNYWISIEGSGHTQMPFGHIWSLAVEEHTYVVLATVAIMCRRKLVSAQTAVGVLVLVTVAFSAIYFIVDPPRLLFTYWLHTETAAFGIVFSAWLTVTTGWRRFIVAGHAVPPLLMAAGIGMHWWSVPLIVQRPIAIALFALALHVLIATPSVSRSFLSMAPWRLLGLWSFSLYLWQQPFYLLSRNGEMNPLVGLGWALCCGLVSFHLVEAPVRRYMNRTWARHREVVIPAPPFKAASGSATD
jgi:peptidoglycan/LPS O-acetylase OafA/YrhL